MCPPPLTSNRKYINALPSWSLLNVCREHFHFNVFGNYKFNSYWGINVIASQKKKVSSLKLLTPFTNTCILMTGKFLVQEKNVLLYKWGHSGLTGPVHSSSCFLFHVLWPEVFGRIIPLWIFTAFRACCQRESSLSSETAKPVQEAQIPRVLSQWLIMTWLRLAVGWIVIALLMCTKFAVSTSSSLDFSTALLLLGSVLIFLS